MKNMLEKEKSLILVGGVLIGTLGLKLLGSKAAKKLYVKTLAGGMKIKNDAQHLFEKIKEDAEDMCYEASQKANEEHACCCSNEK
jgi:hypothetical protein